MKIYLAGGMRSEWRSLVKENCKQGLYFDPTSHHENNPDAYTLWDLAAIDGCDILFGYLAEDNPSGIGLALEIGYAKALDKTIIFVCQKDDKYFDIVKSASDVVFDSLEEGIHLLINMHQLEI